MHLTRVLILSTPNLFELDLGYLNQKYVTKLVKQRNCPMSQGLRTLDMQFCSVEAHRHTSV